MVRGYPRPHLHTPLDFVHHVSERTDVSTHRPVSFSKSPEIFHFLVFMERDVLVVLRVPQSIRPKLALYWVRADDRDILCHA